MTPETEPAYVLFSSDKPKPQAAAEARLNGNPAPASGAENSVSPTVGVGDGDTASTLFPSENSFDERVVSGELDPYLLGAHQDGDTERVDALRLASSALAADFKAAGTPAEDFKDAMAIVRSSGDTFAPPSEDQLRQSFDAGMTEILAEHSMADIDAARTFIRDLETKSPGVVASLEKFGGGSDPRLVRAAIREARRRGY